MSARDDIERAAADNGFARRTKGLGDGCVEYRSRCRYVFVQFSAEGWVANAWLSQHGGEMVQVVDDHAAQVIAELTR